LDGKKRAHNLKGEGDKTRKITRGKVRSCPHCLLGDDTSLGRRKDWGGGGSDGNGW